MLPKYKSLLPELPENNEKTFYFRLFYFKMLSNSLSTQTTIFRFSFRPVLTSVLKEVF